MIGIGTNIEWLRYLDAESGEDAVGDLRRMISRLEGISDEIGDVLRFLSGSPSVDLEEILRVSRSANEEAIGLLAAIILRIRQGDPEAA